MWRWLICLVYLVLQVQGKVLVLGSGGLIGTALVQWLRENNFETVEVVNRGHIDLRVPGALDVFNDANISFVFFLACEVGGAKFIHSSEKGSQRQIVENNVLMYQTVFKWLDDRQVPFLFTSSYLQGQPNAYGSVKRLGEAWIKGLGIGKIVRLWNIYGPERIGLKSHVLTDWVHSCLRDGRILCLTDGTEPRQFLHVNDTAAALGAAMRHYSQIEMVTDISSDVWTRLHELGEVVTSEAPRPCPITYSSSKAAVTELISPNTTAFLYQVWGPRVTLHEGVRDLFLRLNAHAATTTNPKKDEL